MVFYQKKINKIFLAIKSKKIYIKELKKTVLQLKIIKTKIYQSLNFLLINNYLKKQNRNFLISYIICFNFSQSNSIIQISDAIGNSKIFCSAGLVDLKGKQKVSRRLVLVQFFRILFLLKSQFIKNKPIALHFKNVGFNKYFIIKKLKKKFFIKLIKIFNLNSYNGCRKKKEKRKR